jgi:hypothetical protein
LPHREKRRQYAIVEVEEIVQEAERVGVVEAGTS